MRRMLAALAIGAAIFTGAGAAGAAPVAPRGAEPEVQASLLENVRYDRHGRWHGPRPHHAPGHAYRPGYRPPPPPHWRPHPARHYGHRPPPPPPHWRRW